MIFLEMDEILFLAGEQSGQLPTLITTLTYLINVHARLTILDFFPPCTHLLYACTLNYFSFFSTLHTKYILI